MYARTFPGQGQKFVAVFKAKNRGAATSQNAKNRGLVAVKITKIAAMSRQKSLKSRLCRGKNRENRGFVAAKIVNIGLRV